MLLDDVFQFLNNTGLARTHAIFSEKFLGHSGRYYDYLRCSGAPPSIKSLVNLANRLQHLGRIPNIPKAQAAKAKWLSHLAMAEAFRRSG